MRKNMIWVPWFGGPYFWSIAADSPGEELSFCSLTFTFGQIIVEI